MLITLGIIFLFAVVIQGQVPMHGKCPSLGIVSPFYPDGYLGTWYEVEKYFSIFESKGKCNTATYLPDINNGGLTVKNTQIDIKTNQKKYIEGTAFFVEGYNVGKLSIVFQSRIFRHEAPYWILDTDYDSFAVVYSCSEYLFFHTDNVWILTRSPFPSQEVLNKAYNVMIRNDLKTSLLISTDHINCPTITTTTPNTTPTTTMTTTPTTTPYTPTTTTPNTPPITTPNTPPTSTMTTTTFIP